MIMGPVFDRKEAISLLDAYRGNGIIKAITGIRRCGKSFLLFELYKKHLIEDGVSSSSFVEIHLDRKSEESLRDSFAFISFINERLQSIDGQAYIFIDEVQYLEDFVAVLNDINRPGHVDIFVTGSNSHLLSSNIATEFRGRVSEVRLYPLSYKEIREQMEYSVNDYLVYGGMPTAVLAGSENARVKTLEALVRNVYIADIQERHKVKDEAVLGSVLDVLCSSIGSITNPARIENTLRSKGRKVADDTISAYIGYFKESFLAEEAKRYDIKGRDYLDSNPKYYIEDNGLRNARLGMRQIEMTHLMENAIYLELLKRGFLVDTGMIAISGTVDGKRASLQTEVDFVARKGSLTVYIQSAYMIPDKDREEQEKRPLLKIADAFPRVIITRDTAKNHYDEDGVLWISLESFLLSDDPFREEI